MNSNTMILAQTELCRLLGIPESRLIQLLQKHGLVHQRIRRIFWPGFLLILFLTCLRGGKRHKDFQASYQQRFKQRVSTNAFSDRLSQIPTALFRDLILEAQPRLRGIGSRKQRAKAQDMLRRIVIEDASCFRLDQRLAAQFGHVPGSNRCGLKLYLSIDVFGDLGPAAKIEGARKADVKVKSRQPKGALELRDRGWFSMPKFLAWVNSGRSFISRIQSQFNPQIVGIELGNPEWVGKKLQSVNLEGHSEVALTVKPFRTKECVYRTKDHRVFTLHLKGKRQKTGVWHWYIVQLPDPTKLNFDDAHNLYRARWRIEETFRELKSSFGGDHIRLYNQTSAANYIYLLLVSWLSAKGFLKLVAETFRRSIDGFPLDICLKGTLRQLIVDSMESWITDGKSQRFKVKQLAQEWVDLAYQRRRGSSKRRCKMNAAFTKANHA